MFMAGAGGGKEIILQKWRMGEGWMSGQEASELWTILNERLKIPVFDPLDMLCIIRRVVPQWKLTEEKKSSALRC